MSELYIPWQESYRKEADYTRVEVGREYSPFESVRTNSTNPPVLETKGNRNGILCADVRVVGVLFEVKK